MAGYSAIPRIPLPNGWPARVRSAVTHATSLAHFSLISTRSWATNNWNARIRLSRPATVQFHWTIVTARENANPRRAKRGLLGFAVSGPFLSRPLAPQGA